MERIPYRGAVDVDYCGAEYRCRLTMRLLLELEEECGYYADDGKRPKAVGEIYSAIVDQRFSLNEVKHTIRLGLIGGGMDSGGATRAVSQILADDGLGLAEASSLAMVILSAALFGTPPTQEEPDPRGPKKKAKPSTKAKSSRS